MSLSEVARRRGEDITADAVDNDLLVLSADKLFCLFNDGNQRYLWECLERLYSGEISLMESKNISGKLEAMINIIDANHIEKAIVLFKMFGNELLHFDFYRTVMEILSPLDQMLHHCMQPTVIPEQDMDYLRGLFRQLRVSMKTSRSYGNAGNPNRSTLKFLIERKIKTIKREKRENKGRFELDAVFFELKTIIDNVFHKSSKSRGVNGVGGIDFRDFFDDEFYAHLYKRMAYYS